MSKAKNELLSLMDLDIIDAATAELVYWDIPWVQVGKPLEDVKISFVALLRVAGRGLLSAADEVALLEELMHVMAAKSGLMTVKKIVGSDLITVKEQGLIEALEDPAFEVSPGFYCGTSTNSGITSEIEWWVQEDTVAVLEVPAGTYFPFQPATKILFKFREAENLSKADSSFITSFLDLAQRGPHKITIEATDEVMDIAASLEREN